MCGNYSRAETIWGNTVTDTAMRIYNCKKYVLQDIAMEKDTITRCDLPTKEIYL